MSLHQRLKLHNAQVHGQLECGAFHNALQGARLPLVSFTTYVRCLAIIHATLEQQLVGATDSRVQQILALCPPRLPLLMADIRTLGADKSPSVQPAVMAALKLASTICMHEEGPLEALGYLYVLEGSQNGGVLIKRLAEKAYGIPAATGTAEGGLRYFGCHSAQTHSNWGRFVDTLNALSLSEAEVQVVLQASASAFAGLAEVLGALFPYDETQLELHASSLNPEAGNHAIPKDPLEVDLALRAGLRAWEKFPYIGFRYGDRGRRFTTSDSCWLVSLIPMPFETIRKSIFWLRTVLATRGLPSLILETHMDEIAGLYAQTFPESSTSLQHFRAVAALLRAERLEVGNEAWFHGMHKRYEPLLPKLMTDQCGPVSTLLAAAWADEQAGMVGAFDAVFQWYCDSSRFDPGWISTVQTISTAIAPGQLNHEEQ
jgi:heme oxygenase